MDDKIIYSYIDEIANRLGDPGLYGAASVMVGAGFSKNASCIGAKNNTPPSWTELSERMYDALYPLEINNEKHKWEECSGKNVLTLAQKYEVTFDRQALDKLIEINIADKDYIPSELHKNLLELSWNDVFTTNYDTLLERTTELIVARKNYKIVYSQDDLPGSVRPRIVKLHGTIEHSCHYIITEEDYRTYPYKYAPFVNTVQQSMLETRLCLIGFSGTDPNFLNWLGWLRDNMGDNCPTIYLCGLFDNLGIAERKMLEQRNINILDLSILLDGTETNRHYTALKKFIDLLRQKSKREKDIILKEKSYENIELICKDSKFDINQYVKNMQKSINCLIEKMNDYVCLPQGDEYEIEKYIEKQFSWILNEEYFDNKYNILNLCCAILKKCNHILYDVEAEKLKLIVNDKNIEVNNKIDIILYMLQMYRFDGKYDEYLAIKDTIEISNLQELRNKNEYLIELAKFYLCIFKINEAYACVDKIIISSYDEYALKKASLLVQLNKRNEAIELITRSIAFLSQQRYSENRNASLIGYANLVARASWVFYGDQELFSDSIYENNAFNCRKIVIKSKELVIETIFENQRPQNRKVSSFNPNAYTINYTYGSTAESKKMETSYKYLMLQDLLCLGIYSDHKNTTDAAIKNIDNSSKYPMWRWYKELQIDDKNIYNMFFTRERIYCTEIEFTKMFFEQICSLLEWYISDNIKEQLNIEIKTLTDIAAKMTIVLDEKSIFRFVKILVMIDDTFKDIFNKKAIINDALRTINYSFNQKIFNYCIDYILDNKLIDYRFISYFEKVKIEFKEEERQKIKQKLINSLDSELESEDIKIRDNAVNKFKIFENILVDSDRYDQLVEKVWNKVDGFGFPINRTYLPIAWIKDVKHDGERKNILYLLEPKILENFHRGMITREGDADSEIYSYTVVLYRMMKLKNNDLFTIKQVCNIIKYFYDYVGNEKNILNRQIDFMGEGYQTENRFIKINNIVLLLCICARILDIDNKEFKLIIELYLSQMKEIGISTKSIELIINNFSEQEIFKEFELIILGGNEKEFSGAFTMLYGCIQILTYEHKESSIDDFLVQFVKKLPYLDINISKKIIPELHSVLRRTVFLEKDNVTVVINIIKMCYDIFKKATGKRLKDGLDGMYNISNLAKTYHKYLKDNNVEIDTKFDTLIDEFKSCKLNEVKFCWL